MNKYQYLCCPICKGKILLRKLQFHCQLCQKKYPFKQKIPILLDEQTLSHHVTSQKQFYEELTSNNKIKYKLTWWQKNYLRRFLENVPHIRNKVILDIGTGSGYMAIELAKRGAFVIACDFNLESLMLIKNAVKKYRLNHYLKCVCCSAEDLPIKTRSIDIVIANAILEHLPNDKKAIAEIDKVCKRKASAMITVPLDYMSLNPLFIPINYINDKHIGHLRRYNKKILLQKFRRWSLIRNYYTGHFKKVIKILINQFIKRIFSEKKIEQEDKKYETIDRGASNIILFLRKNG